MPKGWRWWREKTLTSKSAALNFSIESSSSRSTTVPSLNWMRVDRLPFRLPVRTTLPVIRASQSSNTAFICSSNSFFASSSGVVSATRKPASDPSSAKGGCSGQSSRPSWTRASASHSCFTSRRRILVPCFAPPANFSVPTYRHSAVAFVRSLALTARRQSTLAVMALCLFALVVSSIRFARNCAESRPTPLLPVTPLPPGEMRRLFLCGDPIRIQKALKASKSMPCPSSVISITSSLTSTSTRVASASKLFLINSARAMCACPTSRSPSSCSNAESTVKRIDLPFPGSTAFSTGAIGALYVRDSCRRPACLGGQRPPDDPRPQADLRPQHHREEGQRQPWAQVRADAADAALGVEIEDHRVGQPHPQQTRFADHHPPRPVAEGVGPAQILEAAVDAGEEELDVPLPAEDHPARDRRDDLDPGGAGGHDPAYVAGFGGGSVARHRVVHAQTLCRFHPSPNSGSPWAVTFPGRSGAGSVEGCYRARAP